MHRTRRWVPLAISLALLLGLGAFGLSLVRASRERAEVAYRETTASKQATVAALTDQYLLLAAKEAFEFAASSSFSLVPGDPSDQASLEDLLAKQEGFFNHGAVLSTLGGSPLSAVVPAGGLPLPDDPGYAPLRSSLLAGEPGVSSLMRTADDIPVVAVGVPVVKGGSPAAILVAYFRADTSHLQRYSEQLGRGSSATGMVIDSTGTIVAARDVELVGQTAASSPLFVGRGEVDRGTADFERDGVDMFAAWAPVQTGGWALVEEQPAADFYAPVRGQSQNAQIALLALLVVGGGAVTILNHRTERARRRGERRCEALVQDASDVITVLDDAGCITYVSPAVHPVLGHTPEERIGTKALDLMHPDDEPRLRAAVTAVRGVPEGRQRLQAQARRADGTICSVELIISNLTHADGVEGVVVSMRDITELTELHDELEHRATHDPLTALPNRSQLQETVTSALRTARGDGSVATLFLDLDGFKAVNDELGHDAGDALLVQVADRLRTCVRDADSVARIGGDEFVMIVRADDARMTAASVAERAVTLLAEPFPIGSQTANIGVSIGIAVGGSEGSPDELLRRADTAMYRAKKAGRGRYTFEDSLDVVEVPNRSRTVGDDSTVEASGAVRRT